MSGKGDNRADVQIATEDDLRVAVANGLRSCGLRFDELEAQHRRGWFDTDLARRTWFAIRELGRYA